MIARYSKIILVLAAALYATLVVFNNLTDYGSNYQFVQHVLKMDTTFPDNQGRWRAIDNPALHHFGYGCIILIEAAVALLCWAGAWQLFRGAASPLEFGRRKGFATAGLTLGILLFLTGFITVGGEWFLMWQSKVWNGEEPAFRIAALFAIILVYLHQPDPETGA